MGVHGANHVHEFAFELRLNAIAVDIALHRYPSPARPPCTRHHRQAAIAKQA